MKNQNTITADTMVVRLKDYLCVDSLDEIYKRFENTTRENFEQMITKLNNEEIISFYYREASGGSDYRGEVYVQQQIFVGENRKYRADIYLNIDFDFSNDFDCFLDELLEFETNAIEILNSFR